MDSGTAPSNNNTQMMIIFIVLQVLHMLYVISKDLVKHVQKSDCYSTGCCKCGMSIENEPV